MASRHTDLLFRAEVSGRPLLIYFIVEHQSEPDRLMPYRALAYVMRVLEAVRREDPFRTTLPPVVTIVVHHGASGWTAPRRFHEVVDGLGELPELARYVPDFGLLVDDLVSEDDEALKSRPLPPFPKVALFLLRDTRDCDVLFAHLAAWAPELEQIAGNREDIRVILRYVFRVAGELPFEVVRRRIAAVAPALEEHMTSIEEELIQRGREQGLAQGREQGLARGREQGLRDALARQLRARFGDLGVEVERRITEARAADLDRLIERVVIAATLDEVFGS